MLPSMFPSLKVMAAAGARREPETLKPERERVLAM